MKTIALSEYKGRYVHIEGPICPEGAFVTTHALHELDPKIRVQLRISGVRRGQLYIPHEDLLLQIKTWSQDRDLTTLEDLMNLQPNGALHQSDRAKGNVQGDIRELSSLIQKWCCSKGLEVMDKLEQDELEIRDDLVNPR